MNETGPAQLQLIRRYARTLREMQSDAVRHRGPRIGAREVRAAASPEPLIKAAKAIRDKATPAS